MKPSRRDLKGDVFHQPLRRPHGRRNPMQPRPRMTVADAREAAEASGFTGEFVIAREFEPVDVTNIRRSFGQTRGQFTRMIGISKETLRNWERGRRYPTGPARTLLRICAANPDVVAAVLVRNRAPWAQLDPDDDPEPL
jgi:DNA-binding transcriptional regulator YiaG